MHKATHFLAAADTLGPDAEQPALDAYVLVCVQAGIAASDVICCAALGEHAQGENHDEAEQLLRKASEAPVARHLRHLLAMKTKAAYGYAPVTTTESKRAGRAAEALVERARRAQAG